MEVLVTRPTTAMPMPTRGEWFNQAKINPAKAHHK